MTKLTSIETLILCGAAADVEELRQTPLPDSDRGVGNLIRTIEDAIEGYVRCEPLRWTGFNTADPSVRMAVSRAYAALERKALVARAAFGWDERRTTHLKVLPEGLALARELTKPEAAVDG